MKLRQRWHAWMEHLRFRYLPPIVDGLIHLSTYQARLKLGKTPLAVLMDTNVLAHGVTHETQWVPRGYSSEFDMPLGNLARVPVRAPDNTSKEYNSVLYLPGITHLARRGNVLLKTSIELQAEERRLSAARLYGGGYYDYSVFRGIRGQCLDALPRGTYSFADLSDARQQRARLDASDDPLFRALVALLGHKNSQDAWHIRTAETYGCFCFLTMDFALLELVDTLKHLEPFASLKVRLMTPQMLGKHLSLTPIPTNFLSYHNASFPVRADLSQPKNKRIKWSKGRT